MDWTTRSASRTGRGDASDSGTFGPTRDVGVHRRLDHDDRCTPVGAAGGRRARGLPGKGWIVATAIEVRQAHQDMLETAARLVDEIGHLPPGGVLRSYWRAVRLMRLAGCPVPALAGEAEMLARDLLGARGVRVPQPRSSMPIARAS